MGSLLAAGRQSGKEVGQKDGPQRGAVTCCICSVRSPLRKFLMGSLHSAEPQALRWQGRERRGPHQEAVICCTRCPTAPLLSPLRRILTGSLPAAERRGGEVVRWQGDQVHKEQLGRRSAHLLPGRSRGMNLQAEDSPRWGAAPGRERWFVVAYCTGRPDRAADLLPCSRGDPAGPR
ncbi:hypothetical protein NDU88_006980 [Pleurodeles waltl]|uniref:Uncharacterized protein n=1 Tax=Pleurodeles waltl TaxID=8319 RepID=A0AAV7VRA0_PLEWA|nr:hypothetical protein NDU88_006980 [Pleurodeles waltl]